MDERVDTQTLPVETPSGKGATDENFPVGSFLIDRRLRPHVAAFYRFARAADDIADNPSLEGDEKIRRLDLFEAALDGGAGPDCARALRANLRDCAVPDRHARDLLRAFRQDAVKSRYQSWDQLLDYCAVSANPVGRFLMDLHGEERRCWPASDALCTVLQILNHLQDCGDDLKTMDRVYIPEDWMDAEGTSVQALRDAALSPALRRVLDRILTQCEGFIRDARRREQQPRSRRLRAEMRVITDLAARLCQRLHREDPLSGRVALSKMDMLWAGIAGLRVLIGPRGRV